MVWALCHLDVEVRRDDGVVNGCNALPRNPDGGRETIGNTLGNAHEMRRASEEVLIATPMPAVAKLGKGAKHRNDRRRFSQKVTR